MNAQTSPGEARLALEIREILAHHLALPVERITLEASLEESLGVDSLKMIEINVSLEERFGFVTPDVALPAEIGLQTVGDLVRFVAAETARQGGVQ